MTTIQLTVDDGLESPMRVDRYLSEVQHVLTRSQLRLRLRTLTVNGRASKPSRVIEAGDTVELAYEDPPASDIEAEAMDLDIIFESPTVIVVNKPQGMVVHPAAGNHTGTLAQGLLHHCVALETEFADDPIRPGIVHRLDKDTSGVLIAAKTIEAKEHLSQQFRGRSLAKKYLAIVKGAPPRGEGSVSGSIGRDPANRKRFAVVTRNGKPAETHYRVLKDYGGYCLVALRPVTGRTHQLRVHLKSLGCPVLGDPVYARRDSRFPEATLMLHAAKLTIRLPGEGEPAIFRAPIPNRMKTALRRLAANT